MGQINATYCCKQSQPSASQQPCQEGSQLVLDSVSPENTKSIARFTTNQKRLSHSKPNNELISNSNKQGSLKLDMPVLKDYLQTLRKKGNQFVVLVEDILDDKEPALFNEEDGDPSGILQERDRLRKLFSRQSGRSPKTPPRRIQTDQLSNSKLIDFHEQQFSQEACSVYLLEDSNPSILFSQDDYYRRNGGVTTGKLLRTEQSQMIQREEEQELEESRDSSRDDSDSERKFKQRKNKEGSRILAKIKSESVLPELKKKQRRLINCKSGVVAKHDEPWKEGAKVNQKQSAKYLNKDAGEIIIKPAKKRTKKRGHYKQSPKKSNINNNKTFLNIPKTGSNIPIGVGSVNYNQSAEEDNQTLGLSLDSMIEPLIPGVNQCSSVNSSNLILSKKIRGGIDALRNKIGSKTKIKLTRHKSFLAQKAVAAINAMRNVSIDRNLFISEGQKLQSDYKVIKRIGQGGCGEVFMVMHLATDQIRAMKIISKKSEKIVNSIYHEIKMLKELDHPNIVKIFDYYHDETNVYIVMEYLKGGCLYDRLKVVGRFGEREAAYIMKQLFQALSYCTSRNIVHRDVKLENVLFVQEENMHVKLVDFGSAVHLDENQNKAANRIVTAYYVAPEIIQKQNNVEKCDVWSCGVILFFMLSGQPPFRGKDEAEILEKVVKAQVNFEEGHWKNVSSRAKFLIKQLLESNIKTRLTMVQAIHSPWIKMLTKIDGSFRIDMHQIAKVLRLLEQFNPGSKFRLLVLQFALNYFHFDQQIEKLAKYYAYMDTRHLANMNERDLLKFSQRIYKDEDLTILLQQQKQIVKKLDQNQSGGISYTEFVIACLNLKKVITGQKLLKIFNLMDADGDSQISVRDLKMFMKDKLELSQCRQIMDECNEYLNGPKPAMISEISHPDSFKINFSSFKGLVFNQVRKGEKPQQEFTNQMIPQPQITGYVNMNSQFFGGEQVKTVNVIGPAITTNPNAPNSSNFHNSAILNQFAKGNSNSGVLISPSSKLLKDMVPPKIMRKVTITKDRQ